jgi:hypothetical protein
MKLEIQNKTNYPKVLQKYFHQMSISSSYDIIGSSHYKNFLYNNDYDLNEYYKAPDTKKVLNKLYNNFLDKFKESEKDQNLFICDFKCGEYNNEAIRWNLENMKKGYQIIKNHKITFEETLLMDSTIKLDEVVFINGITYDITNNYFLKIGNNSNYDTNNTNIDIKKNLENDYNELIKEHKYFKALKRKSSIYQLEHKNKIDDNLLKILNSDSGRLYKVINDLNLITVLLDLKGKKPTLEQITNNLQQIKYFSSKIVDYKINFITNDIDNICKLTNYKTMSNKINKLSNKLNKILNKKIKKLI